MTFREDYYYAKWGEKPRRKENKTIIDDTSTDVKNIIQVTKKEQKINISSGGYKGYKIDLYEGRVIGVRFIFNEKKYKVSFNYSTSVINPHNSSGNKEEKEFNKVDFIGNIQIQSKDKVGYGAYKTPRNNKYRDAGIALKPLTKFIKQVLFEYKNN